MHKVYLVGAGPGDIGLITLWGLELIQRADVIIYDHLVNRHLLDYSKHKAERIYAVSYTHLRAHETVLELVCRILLEKKNNIIHKIQQLTHIPFTQHFLSLLITISP